MRTLIAFASLLTLSLPGCKDKNCPDNLLYLVPYSLSPTIDTFNIGDTIWVSINFDDVLTDVNGGIQNTFTDYDFRLKLQCDKIDVDPPEAHMSDYFYCIPVTGHIDTTILPQSSVSEFDIYPVYSNRNYQFRAALITRLKGIYLMALNPYGTNNNPFKIQGECDSRSVNIDSKRNDGKPESGNYYLLKYSPSQVYFNFPVERFTPGLYAFVVK